MASKRNPSDPSGSGARQPRKPPTIELESTEFAADSATSGFGDAAPPKDSPASAKEGIAWLPSGSNWPLVGAGVLVSVGILLVLALFWFTGAIGGGSASADRIAGIEAQLRELGARLAAERGDSRGMDELAARLARIEKSVASPQAPLSDAALANRLTSAENTSKTAADDIANLAKRIDELAAQVRAIPAPVDRAEIDALINRIAALEKSAGNMESELGKRATLANDSATRLALATSALRTAVERGEPFSAELAAARPLTAENALASLEPFAGSGVPSTATLARELSALVPAMRTAANAIPAEGGFFDRIKSSASRLVRIRPAEESPSDDPAAVITRIDAKAARSDVAGALVDLVNLPPATRAPAQAWIEKAQARIAAVETSRKVAADAINALGKATP